MVESGWKKRLEDARYSFFDFTAVLSVKKLAAISSTPVCCFLFSSLHSWSRWEALALSMMLRLSNPSSPRLLSSSARCRSCAAAFGPNTMSIEFVSGLSRLVVLWVFLSWPPLSPSTVDYARRLRERGLFSNSAFDSPKYGDLIFKFLLKLFTDYSSGLVVSFTPGVTAFTFGNSYMLDVSLPNLVFLGGSTSASTRISGILACERSID